MLYSKVMHFSGLCCSSMLRNFVQVPTDMAVDNDHPPAMHEAYLAIMSLIRAFCKSLCSRRMWCTRVRR